MRRLKQTLFVALIVTMACCSVERAGADPIVWPVMDFHGFVDSLRFDRSSDPAVLAWVRPAEAGGYHRIVRISLANGSSEPAYEDLRSDSVWLGWGVLPDGRLLALHLPSDNARGPGIWLYKKKGHSRQIVPPKSVESDANGETVLRTIRALTVGPKGDVFVLVVAARERQPTVDEIFKVTEHPGSGDTSEWRLTKVAGGGPEPLPLEGAAVPAHLANVNGIQLDSDKFSATHDGGFLFTQNNCDVIRATPLPDGTFELRTAASLPPPTVDLTSGTPSATGFRLLSFSEAFDGSIIAWARVGGLLSNPPMILKLTGPHEFQIISGDGTDSLSDLLFDALLVWPHPAASFRFSAVADWPALLPLPDGSVLTVRRTYKSDGTGQSREVTQLLSIDNGSNGLLADEMNQAAAQLGEQNPHPAIELRKRLKQTRDLALLTSPRLPLESDEDAQLRLAKTSKSKEPIGPLKFVELASQIRRDNHLGRCLSRSHLAQLPAELTDELGRYNAKHCHDDWWKAFQATLALNLFNTQLGRYWYGNGWGLPDSPTAAKS